jgi:hypothetical protein
MGWEGGAAPECVSYTNVQTINHIERGNGNKEKEGPTSLDASGRTRIIGINRRVQQAGQCPHPQPRHTHTHTHTHSQSQGLGCICMLRAESTASWFLARILEGWRCTQRPSCCRPIGINITHCSAARTVSTGHLGTHRPGPNQACIPLHPSP